CHAEAIAILPFGSDYAVPDALTRFELITDEGEPTLWAIGRIAKGDEDPDLSPAASRHWRPGSWRARPAQQLPVYDDANALARIETRLAQRAPIVELHDVDALSRRLAAVGAGKAILLQMGDCAEAFDENIEDKVR